MGSFGGHIDEGSVFIILAVWWLYNITRDYFKSRGKGQEYEGNISYPSNICGRRIPLEIMLKIGFPVFGFLAECFSSKLQFVDDEGNFIQQHNLQHMTIYFLFSLHGVADLISYRELSSMREMNYITAGLAFAWYGGAFYYHSDISTGKPPLERMVHRLPVFMMFITGLMCFIEVVRRDLVVIQVIRCHAVLTFGTWFSYISFIIFSPTPFPGRLPNPNWDWDSESNAQFMVTAFGVHLIINMLIIMTSFYIAESYRKCARCLPLFKGQIRTADYEKVKLIDATDSVFGENEV